MELQLKTEFDYIGPTTGAEQVIEGIYEYQYAEDHPVFEREYGQLCPICKRLTLGITWDTVDRGKVVSYVHSNDPLTGLVRVCRPS